jgi:16S rRNA (adenine1518-N6/adenine1519-N6)-dimethyltransferase
MDVNEVKIYLKQNNFVPSKKMGQNFLTDDNIAQNIIKFIKHMDFDHVMEIGPGLGAITEKLIEINNSLTAVEIDKRLFSFLKKKYKNLNVINNDVLEMD